MQIHAALTLLGLCWSDHNNTQAIKKAWKQKVLSVHPDKSTSHTANEQTQQLNNAKDVLLAQTEDLLDKLEQQAEEERAAYEKEKAVFEQKCNEIYEKAQQARHERYTQKRKKRAEGSRVHRKVEDYPEGKALIEEMKTLFKNRFVSKEEHVSMADIMDLFVKSREITTDLEKHLFHRHARRIFAATWPYARYTKHFNKWSFYGVALNGSGL